jgi:septal ring factor EnvC (AmiA/AmiB activator)
MLKRFCALLLLACCFSRQVLRADIYLTDSEYGAIREELRRMYRDTTLLYGELNAQRAQSKTLLETSAALRERLESALAMLEESRTSLDQSEADLTALLTELAGLRLGYGALWESWTKQKNETQKWKLLAVTGWTSAGLILGGGIVWGILK